MGFYHLSRNLALSIVLIRQFVETAAQFHLAPCSHSPRHLPAGRPCSSPTTRVNHSDAASDKNYESRLRGVFGITLLLQGVNGINRLLVLGI